MRLREEPAESGAGSGTETPEAETAFMDGIGPECPLPPDPDNTAIPSVGMRPWRMMTSAAATRSRASSMTTTPLAAQTASNTAYPPARLAVCDRTARVPGSVRPALAASTGLPRSLALRASATNRPASSRPSR